MDTYTKAVLTVIAMALSTIAAEHFVSPATAQQPAITKVLICDFYDPTICAGVGLNHRLNVER